GLKLDQFAIFRLTFSIEDRHMIGSQSRFRLDTNEKRLHLDLMKYVLFFYEEGNFYLYFFFRFDNKSDRPKQEMHQMDKSENLNRYLRQNISSSRALTFPCFLIIAMSLPSALSRATPAKEHLLKEFR
ncbi:hypothetical protein ALC60_08519, partial [Trachymyrmex zeteki]